MSTPDLRLGQGDAYVMRARPGVVTDRKVLKWRWGRLEELGFSHEEALLLAKLSDVDVHRVADWLTKGASHVQVLQICQPLEDVDPPVEDDDGDDGA